MSDTTARGARVVMVLGCALLLLVTLATRLRAQVNDPAAVVKAYYAALEKEDFGAALALIQNPSMTTRNVVDSMGEILSSALSLRPPLPQTPLRSCESNLKNIGTALEMYSTDNGGRYPLQMGKLTPDYLRSIPTCPAAHAETYTSSFRSASNPDAYTVYCSGTHHAADGVSANHPAYNSTTGLEIGATTTAPPSASAFFRVVSVTILSSNVGDNRATVKVVERYTVFDYPARVFTTFPLVRDKDGWRIDGAAMAASESPSAVLFKSGAVRFNWLRIHGLGALVASAAGYYGSPEGKKMIPRRQADMCANNLKNYGTALEMYATDNGGRFPLSTAKLMPGYFKTLPVCPAADHDTYAASYEYSTAPDAYTIFCKGTYHAAAGLSANSPCYTSTTGLIQKKEGE